MTDRSSLTSSGSGSSSESTSAKNRLGSAKSRWKQMKKGSMKKLSNLTNRLNLNVKGSNAGPHHHHHHGVPNSNQNPGDVVSTAPDGRVHGVLPRIQASKSMQNLEQVRLTNKLQIIDHGNLRYKDHTRALRA